MARLPQSILNSSPQLSNGDVVRSVTTTSVREDEMKKRSTDRFTMLLVAVVMLTAVSAIPDEPLDPAKTRME